MKSLFYRRLVAETINANGEVKLGYALELRGWVQRIWRVFL